MEVLLSDVIVLPPESVIVAVRIRVEPEATLPVDPLRTI